MPTKDLVARTAAALLRRDISGGLLWQFCPAYRLCFSLSDASPYLDADAAEPVVKPQYLADALSKAKALFVDAGFGDRLFLVYEDKYGDARQNEPETVSTSAKTILAAAHLPLDWTAEDGSVYHGTRHLWEVENIDLDTLFEAILRSDLGDATELDSAVYLIDPQNGNVWFLYDDRGADLYSFDSDYCTALYQAHQNDLLDDEREAMEDAFGEW